MNIKYLRKKLKQKRSLLPKQQQKQFSLSACQHIWQSTIFQTAKHIALYIPVNGEADPRDLLNHSSGKQHFYLPVLSPAGDKHLIFIEWTQDTSFKNNIYGIPEPIIDKNTPIIPARQLDLVIMPLLAFDQFGNRLGMGGGYYDRSFAFKLELTHSSSPHLMGFAYGFQQIDILSTQLWDVPLNSFVTEKKLVIL